MLGGVSEPYAQPAKQQPYYNTEAGINDSQHGLVLLHKAYILKRKSGECCKAAAKA